MTSSKVTRPMSRPEASTTGTDATLYRAIMRATSSWSRSGVATARVGSMIACTTWPAGARTRRCNGSSPASVPSLCVQYTW